MVMSAGGDKVYFSWLDDNTLLTTGDVKLKDFIAERAAGKDGLDTNAEFMALLKNVDSDGSAWFAMIPSPGSPAAASFAQFPTGAPKGVFGSVLLEGGLGLDVGARFADDATAKQVHGMAQQAVPEMQKQAGPFGEYLAKLKIQQAGTDVIVQAKLSEAELSSLVGIIEKQLGGLGSLM
jgi:hypothetical protein